ncbi:MAG: NADH-quinone oxidoreductase, subunit NuoG, partial [Pseudomonadota bacterium]
AHPGSTVEELHLLAKLVRGFGSESVDHRLRHADFSNAAAPGRARWLGRPIASLATLDRAFVVGSFLRKDHPLLAQRLRQAARRGARIASLNAVHDDWAMPLAATLTAAPSQWLQQLADVAAAVARLAGVPAPLPADPGPHAQAVAELLAGGSQKALLLGQAAAQHPQAAQLLAVAHWIAAQTGATVGYLGDGGNAVGAQLVCAQPGPGGLNAAQMLTQPMKALLLLHTEPQLDGADAAATAAALARSGLVVAMTAFFDGPDSPLGQAADVLLPTASFTETGGSFVNAEGRLQAFHGVVKPLAETRPGWKILRVLGNLLGLPGFEHDSVEAVRAEALGDVATLAERLDNNTATQPAPAALAAAAGGLERIADVPIYATDMIVRRATSLQLTADAREPVAGIPPALWAQLGLADGDRVRVSQGQGHAVLAARRDDTLASTAVRVSAGHPATAALGAMFGPLSVEKA